MDKATFYKILQNHKALTDTELFALREIIRKFPYFQTARILYLQILHEQENIHYQEFLHTTAVYVADRSHLKAVLQPSPVRSPGAKPDEKKAEEADIYTILAQLQEKVDRLLKEQKDIDNRETESGKTEQEKEDAGAVQPVKNTFSIEELEDLPPIKTLHSQEDHLIDKYLEGDNKERKESTFYDPAKMAQQSLEDRDDIVSETLARLYYQQGYYQKAIKIYRKLILLYPKNSSYFAALIKEIESKS